MKILQVISYFSPKFGGDINVCTNLSKELAKRNHEVTIITTDFGFDPQYAQTIRDAGVNVIPFHCSANFGLFLYSPSIKIWLKDNLKNYDIIHLHNYRSYQNAEVRTFAIKFGIPYIVQAHGSVLPFFEKHNLKKLYDVVWGDRILRDASTLIALTENESEQYQKMGLTTNKIEIIPNGIDLAKFENLPEFGKFRRQYGIKENSKMILYVGRLHKSKGLDLLIDAFSEINKIKVDAYLIIIGPDDGYLKQLNTKIQKLNLHEKIRIIGFVTQDEKIKAFMDADAFVTPSYSGFPVTFLEACACGLPIVTTCKGDELGWINNNVGFVVAYDRYEIQKAIQTILENEDVRQRFQASGIDLVKKSYNWQVITGNLEKMYSNIIQA